jgi:hypothetical protein
VKGEIGKANFRILLCFKYFNIQPHLCSTVVTRNRDATREIGGIKSLCDLLTNTDQEKVCTWVTPKCPYVFSLFLQFVWLFFLLLLLGSREYLLGSRLSMFW